METLVYKPLNSIWLKASVVGSFWASVEIILGSFLHNLKIPLSGTILSFITVYLLISFMQIWKEKGLIIRAGLVCALMKSISPSAIIIGPMIGILTEAVLLEFFIFILGRNLIGYMIGGAFAVLSALLHKIVSLILLYGLDLIKILSDLYKYSTKQINLEGIKPEYLVLSIAGIYIISGLVAAFAGYISGNKYIKRRSAEPDLEEFKLQPGFQLFSKTTNQKYSAYYLLLNLIAIIVSLYLINLKFSFITLLFPVAYISFCIINYKSSLIRFKKISVWVQFAIITLAAAFVWNGIAEHNFLSSGGLVTGIKMISRAVIVIIGFAAIGIELKNPLIKSVLYNRGFANLYQSLTLSFSALPGIISSLPESKNILKKQYINTNQIFGQAELLLNVFERDHLKKSEIIIITGDVHQGKTTFTNNLINNLKERNIQIAGFLSAGVNKNGERQGFELIDIQTSKQIELCTKEINKEWFSFGHYYFNPDGIRFGKEILSDENISGKQLIVIDEVGPIELNNKGWSSSIDNLTNKYQIPQLWIVRKSLVRKIARKWNIGNVYIFDISDSSQTDVENKILEILN